MSLLRLLVFAIVLLLASRSGAAEPQAVFWPPLLDRLTDYLWIEDEFPTGANLATNKGDHAITWVEQPVHSGSKAMLRESDGLGQHYFSRCKNPLFASPQDSLFVWVRPDTEKPPKAIMLQVNTVGWRHRANWGDEDVINYGRKGTPEKHLAGPMPEPGRWTRLEVPLRDLGITNGVKISGLAFTVAGGRVFWDAAGLSSVYPQPYRRPPDIDAKELNLKSKPTRFVWIDDAFPLGAGIRINSKNHPSRWSESEKISGNRSMEREAKEVSQHYFEDCQQPLTVASNDVFFAWIKLDPKNPPTAVMLQYYSNRGWAHRACWGEHADIEYGAPDTPQKVLMGELPKSGEWVRLQVPAQAMGILPGMRVTGMAFTQHQGRVWWDRAGILTHVNQAAPVKSLK